MPSPGPRSIVVFCANCQTSDRLQCHRSIRTSLWSLLTTLPRAYLSIISTIPSCRCRCHCLSCPVLARRALFFFHSCRLLGAPSALPDPTSQAFRVTDCCLVIHPDPWTDLPSLPLCDTCATARLLPSSSVLALHPHPPYCRPATLVCLSGPPRGSTPETRIDVAPDICRARAGVPTNQSADDWSLTATVTLI